LGQIFFHGKDIFILTQLGWATFLAIFSQTHLVAPISFATSLAVGLDHRKMYIHT
jgi:hypothetical protein